MNLPATAIDFLGKTLKVQKKKGGRRKTQKRLTGVFHGLFQNLGISSATRQEMLPFVHCHCFSSDLTHPEADIRKVFFQSILSKHPSGSSAS